jgi:hypothetical protein
MVELNARILVLLADYKPSLYSTYLREGITWLLSTREAWGAWHNEIGTANAVRALLRAGIFGKEVQSEITIMINGEKAGTVSIDPADPFLSAAKLHYLEITRFLDPGDNTVEVTYTGNLTASVILEKNEWSPGGGKAPAFIGVEKRMPAETALDQSFSVNLALESGETRDMIIVRETIPPQCQADEKSLDTLVRERRIIDYRIDDGLILLTLIPEPGRTELRYRLLPVRKGRSLVKGTRILKAADGTFLGETESLPLTVQ